MPPVKPRGSPDTVRVGARTRRRPRRPRRRGSPVCRAPVPWPSSCRNHKATAR